MPIKVKGRYKKGEQRKKAVELGEVADIDNQNWETLMGFKPSLKPYGADPHNPPTMSTDNAPLPTENDDNKPDQGNLASGGDVEKENPPHENEKVDHIKSNSEQKTTQRKNSEGVAEQMNNEAHQEEEYNVESGSLNSEEEKERYMNDYREKWTVSNKIADIKISAGQWRDNDRYAMADHLSQRYSLQDLKSQLHDNEQMLGAVTAQKKASKPAYPHGYTTSGAKSTSTDPLADILGDLGYEE